MPPLVSESEREISPDAVEFAWTRLKFRADEKQAEILRSDAKRGILNCARLRILRDVANHEKLTP